MLCCMFHGLKSSLLSLQAQRRKKKSNPKTPNPSAILLAYPYYNWNSLSHKKGIKERKMEEWKTGGMRMERMKKRIKYSPQHGD